MAEPIERLSSGSDRLDLILGGGLPTNAITMLAGLPGSGKTILAQQYLFRNATVARPAVYLSTVAEPMEKILRYGQTLSFFDPGAVGTAVIYDTLGPTLRAGGLPAVTEQLISVIKERRPGILVIDSFKALGEFAEEPTDLRRFLDELSGWVSAFPVASFWVGEYEEREIATRPEFAIADAIVQLASTELATRRLRILSVHKLRGSWFASGNHAYRISAEGVDVYPRLADLAEMSAYRPATGRYSSGIPALDAMLLDGFLAGSSTLCAGPSGVGKTLMGLHFVVEGARRHETGIIASLQENHSQLERVSQGFGWSLDGPNIHVLYRSPVDIYIDQWVYELLDVIERTDARRVLIDGLSDLEFAAGDPTRFREFMYSLIQRCTRRGVSLFMTGETHDLFTTGRFSDSGISHLADNLILLQYVRGQESVGRSLAVLKTRGSRHDLRIRAFRITAQGIELREDGEGPVRLGP